MKTREVDQGRRARGFGKQFYLGLLIGAMLIGATSLVVFYNRTSQDAARKIKSIIGFDRAAAQEQALNALYAMPARRATPSADWGGVISPTHPQWRVRKGYDVKLVAKGFDYAVNIAFVKTPSDQPDAPLFYVNELHGAVKYVTRQGRIETYATGLRNFKPIDRETTDQTGLSGLTTLPDSEDLLLTLVYQDAESGLLKNRIVRLISEPGGRKMTRMKILLDMDEFTSPSHQIQQINLGDDGYLYISVGDGEASAQAQNLNRWGGKILRMNLDGSPCEENPFYDESNGRDPINYIFAYGVRNIFDFAQEPTTGRWYGAENGVRFDRLMQLRPGLFHGWNGHPQSTRFNALFSWSDGNNIGPSGCAFLHQPVLGPQTYGRLFVGAWNQRKKHGGRYEAEFGQSILEINLDPESQTVSNIPEPIIQYNDDSLASVTGIAEGPDGLYFTDFVGETADWAHRGQGAVWKLVVDEATLQLQSAPDSELAQLKPEQRGWIYFQRNCVLCHRVGGAGGHEGPDLSHAYAKLKAVLHSPGYATDVNDLIESDETFFVQQRPRLKEVMQADKGSRIKIWLRHHLEEPRFDNPLARMPSFSVIPSEQREDIIAFLMTLK